MKKSLVIITLLLVLVSAFSVNALVTKRTAMWGFGMKITGMAAAEAVCTDSDNSYSYNMSIFTASPSTRPDAYVFGIVNYTLPTGSIFVKDACYNGTHMAEQFCQQGKYKGTQGITCPNGCSDGACLVNPIITPPAQTCTDSDNGFNFDVMSTITGVYNGINFTWPDYCNNATTLYEMYCGNPESPSPSFHIHTCPNGCSNGACLVNPIITPPAQTCTDSDNSVNYSVAGQITGTYDGNNFTWPDYCNNATTLYEMYCGGPNSSSPSFNIHTCPNGCSNSACLPPPVITPGCHDVEAEFHMSGPGTMNPLRIQLNSAAVFIVNSGEYLVNFTSINNNNATFIVNGELISLRIPQTKMLGNGVSFKLLGLNNTPVCGSDGNNYESACLAGAAGAAVSCTGSCPCPPPVCTDSDNGINASVRGHLEVHGAGNLHEWADDCCVTPGGKGCAQNGTQVIDYYCSPNNLKGYDSITLPCPNGCAAGICLPATAIVGPAPVAITAIASEQDTCVFNGTFWKQTCSSSKGKCSGTRNKPQCTIKVSGTVGEQVTWTSTCKNPKSIKSIITTINGTNKAIVFACDIFSNPFINQ